MTLLAEKVKPKLKKPSKFQVLLLNDDYTTMDFVVEVLVLFFAKDKQQASKLMLQVHMDGEGICGVYGYDLAQTKVTQVMDFAKENNQPLICVLRKLK